MEKITRNAFPGGMAGNKRLFAAPDFEIQSIDYVDVKTKIATMRNGFEFGEIEADSFEMNSDFDNGVYRNEVKCLLTATRNAHDSLFDKMTRQRFVVKIKDNNNNVWLAGSLSEPLIFTWRHVGKAKAGDRHLYELVFRRDSTEPFCNTIL
ncbi:hypothetical protein LJC68_07210 [Bacteroidales bacterium OttesenSCG-928-B11]|nr:hypothetical protein [Bacteroidales bacterium OttesenSCG-928-C03]MDL2312647.1 hypothetical protein [Bacteroidales bacterium OttesenSCG-928-B11]MDL2326118.1 hypothetical protein [Bacteroidales bacterium OttesenSCG-928-A14]